MTLTDKQIAARDGKITASRVGVLMSSDPERILNLWKELIGDPAFVPDDLGSIWAVALGSHTESLHLDWMEAAQGFAISRKGEVVIHPEYQWAACTLDGFSVRQNAPVECKHVGAFVKRDDVLIRYLPQLTWQMLCTGTSSAVLSVIYGAAEPVQETIGLDAPYASTLLDRAKHFWHCVETLTPPIALESVEPPVPHDQMREVDMSGSNEWGNNAAAWVEHRDAAKKFETATKELKALIPQDVKKATGFGVCASRAKNGAISIKQEKAA